MKKLMMIFAISATTFFACNQTNQVEPVNNAEVQAQSAQNALRVMSSIQELDRLGFGSPSIFNEGVGLQSSGRSSNGRGTGRAFTTASSAAQNSGDGDGGSDWATCANEEFTENADGSYTWILDYGVNGCEESDGYFMKGKMIETFFDNGNSFSSTTEYFNFGDNEFSINGKSAYTGTYTEPENTGENDSTWAYAGSYTFSEDLEITFDDETYAIEAEGKETFDENGFTADEGFTKCTSSTGDFFHTVITTALFYSFECEFTSQNDFVFVSVSGEESTSYKETNEAGETETGEFTINYGDGTCDNIVTITIDGVSTEVDLGEEWEEDSTNG